jgi:hypothetical protein
MEAEHPSYRMVDDPDFLFIQRLHHKRTYLVEVASQFGVVRGILDIQIKVAENDMNIVANNITSRA